MYVRIGFRLSSLDVGTCARICRLGAILGSCTRRAQAQLGLGLGLGLGFRVSGSRGQHARQYFGEGHGIYGRIGYRLASLDMGTYARICRLGAILGRGTGTSTIRVSVRVRVSGSRSTCMSICWRRARHIR